MTLSEVITIVISALGGGAAALALFIKFGVNKLVDMVLAKYQEKLDEELETHKAKVNAKNHVTQFRFDKEFEILHKLVMDYYDFTYLTWDVYLALGSLSEEDFEPAFKTFQNACDEYTKFFFRNSVIIRKDIADAFEVGIKHINDFRTLSQHCRNEQIRYNDSDGTDGFETHVIANIERLKLIHDELNTGDEYGIHKIIFLVRSYLDSLEVI